MNAADNPRFATSAGSRFRIVPAAALRGFANSGSPLPRARGWSARTRPRQEDTSPRTSIRPSGAPFSRSGIVRMVRTFCGHFFPADPVAARRPAHSTPVDVGQRDAQAIDLQLRDVGDRRSPSPAPFLTRSSNARSSSSL